MTIDVLNKIFVERGANIIIATNVVILIGSKSDLAQAQSVAEFDSADKEVSEL